MAKKKTSTPVTSDTSGMSLADFKANYSTPAPASSASVGITGKTYKAPGTGKAYVGPANQQPVKVKTAGKGFAGSGTPLGTSVAGTNLSKGNVTKTALMALTVGGPGAAQGVGSSTIRMASKVIPDEIARFAAPKIHMITKVIPDEIGRMAGSRYLENAVSEIASKLPNVGGKLQSIPGTVFTEAGSFPGKQTFVQTPARTIKQMAGTTKGLITKAENQASTIAGYVAGGAKTGIKTGIKTGAAVGGAIAGGAGTVVGYLVGSNKNKKKK